MIVNNNNSSNEMLNREVVKKINSVYIFHFCRFISHLYFLKFTKAYTQCIWEVRSTDFKKIKNLMIATHVVLNTLKKCIGRKGILSPRTR